MSNSTLNGMKQWAVYMDKGIKDIEDFLKLNRYVDESEENLDSSLLKDLTDDIKSKKLELRSDISSWKSNSEELKQLLEKAETKKIRIIESLTQIASVLNQNTSLIESDSESITVNDSTSFMDTSVIEPGPSQSFVSDEASACSVNSTNDESYVVVEVTPGLESKVPKSRLLGQNEFVAPPTDQIRKALGFVPRRKTLKLVYSPCNEEMDTSAGKVSSSAYHSLESETTVSAGPEQSPNSILERPVMPVLSSYVRDLLGEQYLNILNDLDTPPS